MSEFTADCSLLLRFTEDNFDPEQTLTIGVDFKTKKLNVDGSIVKLAIWDTAGQERFRTLTPSYYRDAQGAILVYDVSNAQSFMKLENWLNELDTYSTKSNIVKMIVGNKIDVVSISFFKVRNYYVIFISLNLIYVTILLCQCLIWVLFKDHREVTREEGLTFARRHQTLFIEASAKTKDGVQTTFEELVQKVSSTKKLLFTTEIH